MGIDHRELAVMGFQKVGDWFGNYPLGEGTLRDAAFIFDYFIDVEEPMGEFGDEVDNLILQEEGVTVVDREVMFGGPDFDRPNFALSVEPFDPACAKWEVFARYLGLVLGVNVVFGALLGFGFGDLEEISWLERGGRTHFDGVLLTPAD